jgi:hypothetical protein
LPRDAPKEDRERQRPVLSEVYRPFTGVAMTPDRLVVTMPPGGPGTKPSAVWLMTHDGTVLAEAELPADPLPGCLAIAGSTVVVGTVDGVIHRFSTTK